MAVVPRHLTGQTRTEAVCYRSADRTLGDDFIIGAILDISISGRRIRRLDRNEMHQSRGGVLSAHRTLWTTQDLKALAIDKCRTEERSEGKECGRTYKTRWSPDNYNNKSRTTK